MELAPSSGPRSEFGLDFKSRTDRGFFCVTDADTACLYDTVFPVGVDFDFDPADMNPPAAAMARNPNLTERTASFGFYNADVPDVAVKVIDTFSHYEVHWGTLSTGEIDIEVINFNSGLTWNSPTTTENGVDREAFVIDADCIFSGSFEIGGPWEWSSSAP